MIIKNQPKYRWIPVRSSLMTTAYCFKAPTMKLAHRATVDIIAEVAKSQESNNRREIEGVTEQETEQGRFLKTHT